MTLQDLGSVGELIAAVATVATLAYLALQIRQNTTVVRTSNYSALTSETREFAGQVASDPELTKIWHRGLQDYRGLSDLERARFHMLISQLFITFQLQMQLHSRGVLDNEFYQQQLGGLAEIFQAPGVHDWWAAEKRWYSPGFREFIDRAFGKPAA